MGPSAPLHFLWQVRDAHEELGWYTIQEAWEAIPSAGFPYSMDSGSVEADQGNICQYAAQIAKSYSINLWRLTLVGQN